jgi:hypothetical protein
MIGVGKIYSLFLPICNGLVKFGSIPRLVDVIQAHPPGESRVFCACSHGRYW